LDHQEHPTEETQEIDGRPINPKKQEKDLPKRNGWLRERQKIHLQKNVSSSRTFFCGFSILGEHAAKPKEGAKRPFAAPRFVCAGACNSALVPTTIILLFVTAPFLLLLFVRASEHP